MVFLHLVSRTSQVIIRLEESPWASTIFSTIDQLFTCSSHLTWLFSNENTHAHGYLSVLYHHVGTLNALGILFLQSFSTNYDAQKARVILLVLVQTLLLTKKIQLKSKRQCLDLSPWPWALVDLKNATDHWLCNVLDRHSPVYKKIFIPYQKCLASELSPFESI